MMVTGEMVTPEQALADGIVDQVYPESDFESGVMTFAAKLAAGPTMAQGYIKLSMNHGLEAGIAQGLAMERAHQNQLFASDDAREGLAAFLAKRPAQFGGT
jgi:enoyl-CoA hydratase/carnithine racemase